MDDPDRDMGQKCAAECCIEFKIIEVGCIHDSRYSCANMQMSQTSATYVFVCVSACMHVFFLSPSANRSTYAYTHE